MRCRYCGSLSSTSGAFCEHCGSRLNRELETQTVKTPLFTSLGSLVLLILVPFALVILIAVFSDSGTSGTSATTATVPFDVAGSKNQGLQQPKSTGSPIEYEDLARAIDQGHMSDYAGKQLRIRAHIRAYGVHADEPYLVVGERLPEKQFPTMFCMLPPSQYERALQFRGDQVFEGMYNSAFPDRAVALDVQFLGTIKANGVPDGLDVYSAQDCIFVQ